MRNPNESRYFDETKGCTLNAKCQVCKKDIYVRQGVYTIYHGKYNVHNTKKLIMSVHDMSLGIQCPECFYHINSDETMPEGYRSYYE